MKFQCRGTTGLSNFPNAPAMVETAGTRKLDRSEGKIPAEAPIKVITAKESSEQAERVAAKKARAEAREKAEREQREERERMRIERRKRVDEREERVAREAKDRADREAGRTEPPSGDEEVELRTPLLNFSKVDILDDLSLGNMPARVSIASENERFTDAERESPKHTLSTLAPEVAPEAWQNTTFGLLETPKGAKEQVPTTPKPWPAPSLVTTQPQVPTPVPAPAKSEPEKPLSLWERKKLKSTAQPTSASGLFDADDSATPSRNDVRGWGGSLLNTIAKAAADPHWEPFPEPAPVKPKTGEAATPAESEEDEFDWANVGKKKKRQLAGAAQMPSVPNTPDPDNADDSPPGGVGSRKKKKGRK